MADEKYHIEDFDDVSIVISNGNKNEEDSIKNKDEKLTRVQPKIIYESSDNYSIYDEDTYDEYYRDIYEDIYEEARSKRPKNKKSSKVYIEEKYPFKKQNSQWERLLREAGDYIFRTSYRKPNTFKATLIGILIGIMILVLGFAKTLVISLIVFVANIIGQLLDENPRICGILNFFIRKLR